jgi:tRNA pseudouridine32 synthase/23S rRNA pseudouridine746 synthase
MAGKLHGRMRDGVAPSYIWLPQGAWPSLLQFLVERFPAIGKEQWQARMAAGDVRSADGELLPPDSGYRPGKQIFYYREIAQEPPIPFHETILYQDERLLVADKPHFLPVTPSGRFLHETLLVRLKKRTGCETMVPIHRIDRETAGVVVFSLDPASRDKYQALFRERAVDKVYEALAPPRDDLLFPLTRCSRIVTGDRFFTMMESPGEPNAQTDIAVLEKGASTWRYELRPLTGKTHQLRVHMLGLGMPILNDLLYPVVHAVGGENFDQPLKLLARSLSFVDPVSQVLQRFESRRQL